MPNLKPNRNWINWRKKNERSSIKNLLVKVTNFMFPAVQAIYSVFIVLTVRGQITSKVLNLCPTNQSITFLVRQQVNNKYFIFLTKNYF
jgi:hypothetical protein